MPDRRLMWAEEVQSKQQEFEAAEGDFRAVGPPARERLPARTRKLESARPFRMQVILLSRTDVEPNRGRRNLG